METKKKSVSEYVQEYGAFIALIVLVVGIGIVSPEFRTWSNFLSLLRQSSINGFIAFGMTCVILTDAIDLSVGSILGLSTALRRNDRKWISGCTGNDPCTGNWNRSWPCQRYPCYKRPPAGIYRNSCYNDCLPWTDYDLYGWKTNFQSW